jgi:hypothetical protein
MSTLTLSLLVVAAFLPAVVVNGQSNPTSPERGAKSNLSSAPTTDMLSGLSCGNPH